MHVAHAAFHKPSTRKAAVAATSDRTIASGEELSTRRPQSLLGDSRQLAKRRKTAEEEVKAVMGQPDCRLRTRERLVRY